MKRLWWIFRASRYLQRVSFGSKADCRDYAESLYETYVLGDSDDWSPLDAISEDMSYWGDV